MEKMMKASSLLVVLAVVVVIMGNEMVVTFGASSGSSICDMTVADFMECRPAVSGNKPLPPTPACCKALKGANIPCLCGFKNNSYLTVFGIDPNLAILLPAKCSLPPVTCA